MESVRVGVPFMPCSRSILFMKAFTNIYLFVCLDNESTNQMPRLGQGSPNASIYPKMRPEPVSYTKYFEDEDDDVSSTAAVNEADDDANEEKKRSATEDDNPGASKRSRADGEGEQIPAAAALPGLPDLVLSMKQDGNYLRIMNEAFKKMDGSEYNATVEKEMAREILQKLRRDYHLLDTNGDSADDGVALQSKYPVVRLNILVCILYI